MHVVKQLATTVFIDRDARTFERIDEMPMPVMEIDTDILAEVSDAMLRIGVRRRPIQWNLNRRLKIFVMSMLIKNCLIKYWISYDK